MPELDLQTYERFEAARKVSIAYGDQFLIDNPPGEEAYLGAWNLEEVPFDQLLPPASKKICYLPSPAVTPESRKVLISGYVEKEDSFTQTDLLDSEEDEVQELIFQIRTSPFTSCRELANRLFTLFNDAKEEDFSSVGIAIGSLRSFYNFFQLHRNLKCPTISLTPGYNIYASWRPEQNRVFSVHFLPSGDVRFVIFKPNDRHPARQIRLAGTATTDILKETVVPFGVWDWITNERR
jgi:hypothetical protein